MASGTFNGRARSRALRLALVAGLLAGGAVGMLPAKADILDEIDCSSDVGYPVPGTQAWDLADKNNQWCAWERQRVILANPAFYAAAATNAAHHAVAISDPFREPRTRWDGIRGQYERVTYTDPRGQQIVGYLFAPRHAAPGSLPGVMLMACNITEAPQLGGMWWAAETVAEHGYMVFCVDIAAVDAAVPNIIGTEGYDDGQRGIDATDYFMSTPTKPNKNDPTKTEYNPMWRLVNRTRPLGFMGHSGGGSLALNAANRDPRFGAVVAFDPSGAVGDPATYFDKLHVPSMIQIADYDGSNGYLYSTPERPVAEPGSKRTYFDTFKKARVDTMQVAFRASTHVDWAAALTAVFGSSLYGEQLAVYYTLAWFDRYLAASPTVRADALRRLTATGRFDDSSDKYSSGAGRFDPNKSSPLLETPFTDVPGNPEGGNLPLKIKGQRIHNRLSWFWPTRYWLNGGALQCYNVRHGCPNTP